MRKLAIYSYGRMKNTRLYASIDDLEAKIFLRIDAKDWILDMCETDSRFKWIFEERIDATDKLERRLKEANEQNNAAVAFLAWGPRGLGKSRINYALLHKIHRSRKLNEWKSNIKFKLKSGDSIDAPSKFNQACIELAEEVKDVEETYKYAIMQDEMRKEWGEGSRKQYYAQLDAVKSLRKIGLCVAVADNDDQSTQIIQWDFQLFVFGFDPKTLESYAVLKFRRWQGIVKVRIPKEVFEFLDTSYESHAQNDVFEQFGKGFYNKAINPDKDDDNSISDVLSGEDEALKKSIENKQFDEFYYDIAGDHLLRNGVATEKTPVMYWVLRNLGRFRPRGKAQKLGKWTHGDIAEAMDVRESAVQKWLSRNDPKINDTVLGDTLELALLSWLNQKLGNLAPTEVSNNGSRDHEDDSEKNSERSSHNPSGMGAVPVVRRSSGPGFCDLYVGECAGPDAQLVATGGEDGGVPQGTVDHHHQISINCKVKTGDRASYDIDVLPEYEHCPEYAYAAVWTPRYGLRIFKANVSSFSTSKTAIQEGLCEDLTLDELVEVIKQVSQNV